DLGVTLRRQPLDVNAPALLLGQVAVRSLGFVERCGVVAGAGEREVTLLVEQQESVPVTSGMGRELPAVRVGVTVQLQPGDLDAVGVSPQGLVEDERVGADEDHGRRRGEDEKQQTPPPPPLHDPGTPKYRTSDRAVTTWACRSASAC